MASLPDDQMAESNQNDDTDPAQRQSEPRATSNGFRKITPLRQRRHTDLLQPLHVKFMQSIRFKDVRNVLATLQENPDGKLHQVEDTYGVSALEQAVVSGSVEIVEQLLEKCKDNFERNQAIERAMLFAIKENNITLVDRLIDLHQDTGLCRHAEAAVGSSPLIPRPSVTVGVGDIELPQNSTGGLCAELYWEDAEFSQDIKPMVLAAQLERCEIIHMLYTRCCPDIHPLTSGFCSSGSDCYICGQHITQVGRQTVEECRKVIEVYKALSSPAYMFQASVQDPILEAFVIADFMNKRQIVDPAYKDEYRAISLRCQRFATDLLGLCRSTKEVHTLFDVKGGIEKMHRTQFHSARFPRLLVAIYFNQKDFVAHPNCQQVMQGEWYSGLPDWVCQTRQHRFRVAAYILMLTVSMPVIFTLYMFRVDSVEQFVKPAANKFIFDSISFILFLMLLFLKVSLAHEHVRGGGLDPIDCVIFIWVIGLTVRYVKMSFRRRDRFLAWENIENSNWRFYEFLMITCFWLHFVLVFVVMGMANANNEVGLKRHKWPPFDPFLWAEMFFAIANVLTVVQVYSFFKVSSTLGPLQVSMKKMVFDVSRFMVLFFVVLSAFAIGMAYLYSGYAIYDVHTHSNEERSDDSFSSLPKAYKRLFWDLFGYGTEEYANLRSILAHNLTAGDGTDMRSHHHLHRMTELVGYCFYGAYHITVIVVLLNMLIAMMANSYNNIEANSDKEWKLARTRLFMNYFNEIGVTCPPFNIIPTRPILGLFAKKFNCCRYFKKKESTHHSESYKGLLERLSKRYWKMRKGCDTCGSRREGDGPGSDDVRRAPCSPCAATSPTSSCPPTSSSPPTSSCPPTSPSSPTSPVRMRPKPKDSPLLRPKSSKVLLKGNTHSSSIT